MSAKRVRRWGGLLIVGIIGILAVGITWFGCWLLVPILASRFPVGDAARFGSIGDMFGAASSLFAGLGALAVVIVLAYDVAERKRDLEHRREEMRPFVMGVVSAVQVDEAKWTGNHFNLGISEEIRVSNAATVPALNPKIEVELRGGDVAVTGVVILSDAPLLAVGAAGREDGVVAEARFSLAGQDAPSLLEAIAKGELIRVSVRLRYQGLNGTSWLTVADHQIRARHPDRALLFKVLDPNSEEYIGGADGLLGGTNVTELETSSVAGSWTQQRDKTG